MLRRSDQVTQQQPAYYQQQHSPLHQKRSAITGSLANVPVSCSSLASTFYQNFANADLQRSDCVAQPHHLSQLRRENTFGLFFLLFVKYKLIIYKLHLLMV